MKTTSILSSTVSFASLVAVATAASSSFIPEGISSTCSAFMTTLNADTTLAKCTADLLTATKAFAPGGAGASSSAIPGALSTLCATGAGCDDGNIRNLLGQFYAACPDELTGSDGGNAAVKSAYDALYVITPMQDAICTKDSATSKYCVLNIGSGSTTVSNSSITNSTGSAAVATSSVPSFSALLRNYLTIPIASAAQAVVGRALGSNNHRMQRSSNKHHHRASSNTTTAPSTSSVAPNATTFKTAAIPFLFMLPSQSSDQLCTPCSKAVLSAYVAWESKAPYAFGLANSPILGGQLDLWNGVNKVCGDGFLTAVTKNTGAAPLAALSGAMRVSAHGAAAASMIGAAVAAWVAFAV